MENNSFLRNWRLGVCVLLSPVFSQPEFSRLNWQNGHQLIRMLLEVTVSNRTQKHPHQYLCQSEHVPPDGAKPHLGQCGIWVTWLDFQNTRWASYINLLRPFCMFDFFFYIFYIFTYIYIFYISVDPTELLFWIFKNSLSLIFWIDDSFT